MILSWEMFSAWNRVVSVFWFIVFNGKNANKSLGNIKILFNDWPYGVEKGISHLVVWTKFTLDTDGEKGKLTAPARQMVDRFVHETFRKEVGADKVRDVAISHTRVSLLVSACLLSASALVVFHAKWRILRKETKG